MNKSNLYTTGEIANMAGVTIRTIRYYDTKDILKPSYHNEAGHRLYTEEDFLKLKKILALKYIGLSLDEVVNIEKYKYRKVDMVNSLKLQKNIMRNKINHMKIVLDAIETAESSIEDDETLDWKKTIDIIDILKSEKELLQEYIDESNLNASVQFKDRFSSNGDWYNWIFKKMNLDKNCKILEIGCGNVELWNRNIDQIDSKMDITLTEVCEEMTISAKKIINDKHGNFKFEVIDPNNLCFEDEEFDVVIANHILFYMNDLDKVLKEIHRVLKPGGTLYSTTIGMEYMEEIRQLVKGFNKNINIDENKLAKNFGLENGEEILSQYFKNIDKHIYNDKLIVDDAKGILEYMYTMPGDILDVAISKKTDFEKYVSDKMKEEGTIYITNINGLFKCNKENVSITH